MRKIEILLVILIILLVILILSIRTLNTEEDTKHYGFYFDYNVNIPPVGKELNILLKSVESINTIFESTDGDILAMFKDGKLIYLPNKDENSLSQLDSVYREEGYWMMEPSYTTELIINQVTFLNGEKEKVDVSITTHFNVVNPEDTGFVITDKSKIKLMEKDFRLKDSFAVNETNEKMLNFLKTKKE